MQEDDLDEPVDSLLAAVARIPIQPTERASDWTPPEELDEYRLIRSLGRGGMGSVWLAEDRLLERLVAVKFIAHAEPDQETSERFAIEARAAARLQHVNVVTVHRYGEIAGRPYLVSEYIRGESLDQLAKPVPWERSLELGIALARGLAAAHRHGIIHRDIKPANAILTSDGDAKLVDFGLAKLESSRRASRPSGSAWKEAGHVDELLDPKLTAPGAVAGTPRYLAPEVRRGEVASRRSDVYGIGCILYELVVGRAPSLDLQLQDTEPATLAAGSDEHARPIASRTSGAKSLLDRLGGPAARFAGVIDRCLLDDPAGRYGSGDELREALEQLQSRACGAEVPEGNPYRGLAAFEAEHRALFFGRGADSRAVLERLRADAFVLVTGDSGAGKSSLCRAGVVPEITEGRSRDGRTWSVVQLVPGHRPLTQLASVLADQLGRDEAALVAIMQDDPRQLVRELRRAGPDKGIVVFVDQLEELCTIAERSEALAFAAVLAELSTGAPGVRLLATVRSDFLTRIAELPHIGGEIARAIYLLRPLSAEGAREAVVGPAHATGTRFESPELVDTLVASIADDGAGTFPAIELPLLAFTLAQLWEARDSSQTISARSLDAIGGVRGALARHAEGVLDHLLPHQRSAARKVLLRLVTAERTRARRSLDELAGFDPAALDALVRGRLVVARGSEPPTFELAHERLIDGWPTLLAWLSESTAAVAAHARLATAVAAWERLARAKEALWGPRQLVELARLDPDDLTASEASFASAARRAVARRRWTRWSVAITIPLVVLALYVGANVLARRDLDRHVATYVVEAARHLADARQASAAGTTQRGQAFERFDAGDVEAGEIAWETARQHSSAAHAAYAQAQRALEAAFLLDTGRDEVRRELAEVTYERLQLAEREHRGSERTELAGRLQLFDPDGELASRLTAPARLILTITPVTSKVSLALASTPVVSGASLAPGSHVLIASAEGHATVRLPLVLAPGETRHVMFELPAAAAVPPGFVYVPPGSFLYGSRDEELMRRFFATAPMHERRTDGFLIARTEVTYSEWIGFLDAIVPDERARRTPRIVSSPTVQAGGTLELRPNDRGAWELQITPASVTYTARAGTSLEYRERATRASQDWLRFPVTGISSEDAQAYTAWLDRTGRVKHARLCSELEWERATRGADGRPYPHGERLAPDDANFDATYGRREGGFGPDVVGSHPASLSPYGLVDASGNVWEITRAASGTGVVMRGGGFYTDATTAHLANRQEITPAFRHLHAGLRVCAAAP